MGLFCGVLWGPMARWPSGGRGGTGGKCYERQRVPCDEFATPFYLRPDHRTRHSSALPPQPTSAHYHATEHGATHESCQQNPQHEHRVRNTNLCLKCLNHFFFFFPPEPCLARFVLLFSRVIPPLAVWLTSFPPLPIIFFLRRILASLARYFFLLVVLWYLVSYLAFLALDFGFFL